MITLGLMMGDMHETQFQKIWMIFAAAIEQAMGMDTPDWIEKIPGVNIVYFVPGEVSKFELVTEIKVTRFSRKRLLALVNVPVPLKIVQNNDTCVQYIFESLLKSVVLTAETFAKKSTQAFDLEQAQKVIEEAHKIVSDKVKQKLFPQLPQ